MKELAEQLQIPSQSEDLKIEDFFNAFISLDKMLDNQILEVSVKRHQISILFKDSLVRFDILNFLFSQIKNSEDAYITTKQDYLIINIEGISFDQLEKINAFYSFMYLINEFAEKICQCPSLEYSISAQYIKCYLDKPGLRIKDLEEYEVILGASGLGELEMHPQRPYLLFINENYEVE